MNPEFIKKVVAMKGDEGQKWIDDIPEMIRAYEEKWSLQVLPPFQLSYNYVAPAIRSNGEHAVLKIGLPGEREPQTELEALRLFDGDGMSALLDSDEENSVILIERLEPGIPVATLDNDDEATRIITATMKKLHRHKDPEGNFPTLEDWFRGFTRLRDTNGGGTGPLSEQIVIEGEELYRHLIDSSTERYLLHGDLHHDNILSATREPYLAIDPQGVIGERIHETAAMLRNPRQRMHTFGNLRQTLDRRIATLSEELVFDRERIRQWGVAQTVLSAIWNVENSGTDWQSDIKIAEILSSLK